MMKRLQKCKRNSRFFSQKANVIKIQIKDKKAELKKLERDKVAYEEWKKEQEKAIRTREIAALISESEYSLDEIKELLIGDSSNKVSSYVDSESE